jgi:hypothetical protein
MDTRELDFVIEVYRMQGSYPFQRLAYRFRFIPVGTTVETWDRPPDFLFNGYLKAGHSLPLDSSVLTYVMFLK